MVESELRCILSFYEVLGEKKTWILTTEFNLVSILRIKVFARVKIGDNMRRS